MKESFTSGKTEYELNFSLCIAGHFKNDPAHGIERENFPENILIYCIKGSGVLRLESEIIQIKKGDIFFICENQSHAYYADKSDPWEIYWIHFTGELEGYLRHLEPHISFGVLHIGYRPEIILKFQSILTVIARNFVPFSNSYANAHLVLLLQQIIISTGISNPNIDNVLTMMQSHIFEKTSLSEFAKESGMSKYYFSREFKKHTGYSPLDYFIRMKIQYACDSLSNTSSSISKISDDLQFSSPYHFSNTFLKVTGKRPAQFRKNLRGADELPAVKKRNLHHEIRPVRYP